MIEAIAASNGCESFQRCRINFQKVFQCLAIQHFQKKKIPLHLISMHNPRILRKTPRSITAIQLLRRHHLSQHRIIINRTRPDHPDRRLGFRLDPHDAAALLARVGCRGVARVGGARESLVGAGDEFELEHKHPCQPDGIRRVSPFGGNFSAGMTSH
jgi:hypothetical protein